jgi:hypothetical protein
MKNTVPAGKRTKYASQGHAAVATKQTIIGNLWINEQFQERRKQLRFPAKIFCFV